MSSNYEEYSQNTKTFIILTMNSQFFETKIIQSLLEKFPTLVGTEGEISFRDLIGAIRSQVVHHTAWEPTPCIFYGELTSLQFAWETTLFDGLDLKMPHLLQYSIANNDIRWLNVVQQISNETFL